MATTLTVRVNDSAALRSLEDLAGNLQGVGSAAEDASDSLAPIGDDLREIGDSDGVATLRERLAHLEGEVIGLRHATAQASSEMDGFRASSADTAGVVSQAWGLVAKALRPVIELSAWVGKELLVHNREVIASAIAYERAQTATVIFGAAARSAIGYVTGLGVAVTAAYGGFKSITAVLDNTGERFVDISTGLESTNLKFSNFAQGAKNAGVTLQQALDEAGKTLEDFGVRSESNLDRATGAVGKLAGDAGREFQNFGSALREWLIVPVEEFASKTVKKFDEEVTSSVDQFTMNVNALRDAYREWRIHQDAAWTDGDSDRARAQADALDNAAAATDRLSAANERNRDSFARLREINDSREKSIEREKELSELRGKTPLGGHNAVTDEEEMKRLAGLRTNLKAKAGSDAQAGLFNAEAADLYQRKLEILDQREREITNRREEEHRRGLERIMKEEDAKKEEREKWMRAEMDAHNKRYEETRKADEAERKRKEKDQADELKWRLEQYKIHLKEQQKAAEQAEKERKQRVTDIATGFGGGTKLGDVKTQAINNEQEALKKTAQLRQQMMQQYVTGDVKGFFQSRQQMFEIERDFLAEQKKLKDKFAKEGNVFDQLKAKLSDKDVVNQVGKQRGDDAARKIMEENKEAVDAARRQHNRGRNNVSDDDNKMADKIRRDIDRAQRDAMKGAQRDFNRGKIGQDEADKAANELTNKTIDAAQKSGKLSDETVAGLRQAADAQKAAANRLQEQQEQIRTLSDELKEVTDQLREDSIAVAGRGARRGGR